MCRFVSFAVVSIQVLSLFRQADGQDWEAGLVSYVLENFDVENVDARSAVNVLLDSIEYWQESEGSTLTASVTKESLHGLSAFKLGYDNGESGDYILQNILSGSSVHASAEEATHAQFSYRHKLDDEIDPQENDLTWRLVFFDSANCSFACFKDDHLEAWTFAGGLVVANNEWQTVRIPLDESSKWLRASDNGNNIFDLGKLKGWRLEFSSASAKLAGSVIVDQLELQGDGSMIGAGLKAASWEEALQDDIFESIYYRSELSDNSTVEVIDNGYFYVNYTVEQTETWGGFIQYDFVAPGRAYFNLSLAKSIAMDYNIIQPSSVPGRAHLRFLLLDSSDCWLDCGHASPGLENYYSFHYILDNINANSFVSVKLEGDSNSESPFWRTGWFGSIGNDILDSANVKGFKIEISMDSQGSIGSLVSGAFVLSNVRVHKTYDPLEIDVSMCNVEPDLTIRFGGMTKFQRIEFMNFAECCQACDKDPSCKFGLSDGRDCFKTDMVHPKDLGYWSDRDSRMWAFVKESKDDFCQICECRKADETIDCRGRDLNVVPNYFFPDSSGLIFPASPSWSAKVLDLRDNPRLVILQAGALKSLDSLQELYLPDNLKYVSPITLQDLSNLSKLSFAANRNSKNFITNPSQAFLDICCGLGEEMTFGSAPSNTKLSFCDFKPDTPGIDALYEDYIQYLDATVLDSLRPSSSFMSEAANSAELCAEYCNINNKCNYFSYDARIVNSEHVCFLLADKGTPTRICCREEQHADEAGIIPGWISGEVPRTRNANGAKVVVDVSALSTADESNDYTVEFQLKLGAMPRRGSVWIEPTLVASQADIVITPPRVVLYDNQTTAIVQITVVNPEDLSAGSNIIIENIVLSCDLAFTATKSDLTVYIQVDTDNNKATVHVLISTGSCLFFVICLTAFFMKNAEQKRRQADLVWHVHPSELKFQDPPEILGRGSFGLVLLAEYRGTQVAVKRVIPQRKRSNKGSNTAESPRFFDFDHLFGAGDQSGNTSVSSDVEIGTASLRGNSSACLIGMSSGGLPRKYKGTTAAGVSSGLRAAQTNYWRRAFQVSSTVDYIALKAHFIEEMRHLSKLRHPCITTVMGAVISQVEEPMLVMEYMDHGSLHDMLHNETMLLDGEHILPILRDITQGVRFLHAASPPVIHGDLKSGNILVDSRLRAKVADFGLSQKKKLGATGSPYWMAPELLRGITSNTPASDVYSFSVILYEVYGRKEPFEGEDFSDVLDKVADPTVNKRPGIPEFCPVEIEHLMKRCYEAEPEKRPSFEELDVLLKKMDVAKVEPSGLRLSFSKKQDANRDDLLEEVFPPHVARALLDGRKVEPESHEIVTIVFSDIVGFTSIASELPAIKVADMLDRLYRKLDQISQKHDLFKVETIGDSWMGVANLTKNQPDHAARVAQFALDAMNAAQETWIDPFNRSMGMLNLRMGFHSGPVVANVVGSRNPRYCLFGDAVNTASRMESHSIPGHIQCSNVSASLLKNANADVRITRRGLIQIKGKGQMECFWISTGKDIEPPQEAAPENQPILATTGATGPVVF